MKVLFCSRLDLLSVFGGDTTQVLETKAGLERMGVTVDISTDAELDPRGYDLVHLFNTQFPDTGLRHLAAAKRAGVPVVLSTIYWDMNAVYRSRDFWEHDVRIAPLRLSRFAPDLAGRALEAFGVTWIRFGRKIARLLEGADALLPNSVAELEILVHAFGYPQARSKAFIVPNAIRPPEAGRRPSPETEALLLDLPEQFVMEAARIESIKGQVPLLRAMRKWCPDLPVVFVGGQRGGSYWNLFQTELKLCRDARYLGLVPYTELPFLYARAKVHALPSLRESPGLSSLEAALAGANLVVGLHAPVQEYFGTDAWICDPSDIDSIGRAVLQAWESPARPALAKRLLADFTWQRAAEVTLRAYESVLARRG